MEQNTFNSNNIDAGSKIASFRVKQSMPSGCFSENVCYNKPMPQWYLFPVNPTISFISGKKN